MTLIATKDMSKAVNNIPVLQRKWKLRSRKVE